MFSHAPTEEQILLQLHELKHAVGFRDKDFEGYHVDIERLRKVCGKKPATDGAAASMKMIMMLCFLVIASQQFETRSGIPRGQLSVELLLHREHARPGEPIHVTYWVHNAGSRPLLVERNVPLSRDFKLSIRTHINAEIPGHIIAWDVGGPYELIVKEDCSLRSDWIAIPPGNIYGRSDVIPVTLSRKATYEVQLSFEVQSFEREPYLERCGFQVPIGVHRSSVRRLRVTSSR